MDDTYIIRLFFTRSEQALTLTARKFGLRLLRTAQNILGDPRDAEESVSDTYLALWNSIPPHQPNQIGRAHV